MPRRRVGGRCATRTEWGGRRTKDGETPDVAPSRAIEDGEATPADPGSDDEP